MKQSAARNEKLLLYPLSETKDTLIQQLQLQNILSFKSATVVVNAYVLCKDRNHDMHSRSKRLRFSTTGLTALLASY